MNDIPWWAIVVFGIILGIAASFIVIAFYWPSIVAS